MFKRKGSKGQWTVEQKQKMINKYIKEERFGKFQEKNVIECIIEQISQYYDYKTFKNVLRKQTPLEPNKELEDKIIECQLAKVK